MTLICLVRHGETDWNAEGRLQGREDIPLNEKGKRQAGITGNFLKESSWSAIITSPLTRAKTTAEIINTYVGGVPLLESGLLIERDYGQASGMTMEERDRHFPDGVIPGKENDSHIKERAIQAIEAIKEQYPDQRVLLVAHGALIKAILKAISNGEIETHPFKLFNTSVSHIESNGEKWRIVNYNQIGHLSNCHETKAGRS